MKSSKNSIKTFFVGLLATIGALTLLAVLVVVVGILVVVPAGKSVPDRIILEVDLEKSLVEYVPDDPLAKVLMHGATTVRDVVEVLERASEDERVVGLVARVGTGTASSMADELLPMDWMGLAVVQEVRDAVKAFAEKGKFTVAYAETFGEFGAGNSAYYLATAFDEVYLQPSGDVGLTGLMYESPFVAGTLDKLHLKPRADHRKEYKSALNMLTETEYTEAHREAMEKVMNSHFDQIVRGITEARGVSKQQVMQLMDRAPLLGEEAVEAKLVDGLLYRDQVYQKLKTKAEDADLLYLGKYLQRAGRPHERGPTIALIYGVGLVHRGVSEYDILFDSPSMGSDTVAAAFRAAAADDKVKAILFRVNSPGGSYVASDTIWREVVQAKQAGKPVIVSMGNVAGSGGYFVAIPATKIVAQPATITGSIGVVGGKILTREFWREHIGVTWDEVHTNENATFAAATHDFSPQQWQKVQELLDRIYKDFTTTVAQGRQMEHSKVLSLAKGRIWTGQDAKRHGLVDELGGFDVALRLARTQAGLDADAPVTLKQFPRPRRLLERLVERGPDSSQPAAQTAAAHQVFKTIRPLCEIAREIGLIENNDMLRMPLFSVSR
jgi:protease-4